MKKNIKIVYNLINMKKNTFIMVTFTSNALNIKLVLYVKQTMLRKEIDTNESQTENKQVAAKDENIHWSILDDDL